MAPVLDKLAGEYKGQIKVCKVDIDESPALADQYEIRSIPALLLFRDGLRVDMVVGVESEAFYRQWLDRHLNEAE